MKIRSKAIVIGVGMTISLAARGENRLPEQLKPYVLQTFPNTAIVAIEADAADKKVMHVEMEDGKAFSYNKKYKVVGARGATPVEMEAMVPEDIKAWLRQNRAGRAVAGYAEGKKSIEILLAAAEEGGEMETLNFNKKDYRYIEASKK